MGIIVINLAVVLGYKYDPFVLNSKRTCLVGGGMSHHCAAALLDSKLQVLDNLRSGWSPGKRSVELPGKYVS